MGNEEAIQRTQKLLATEVTQVFWGNVPGACHQMGLGDDWPASLTSPRTGGGPRRKISAKADRTGYPLSSSSSAFASLRSAVSKPSVNQP